MSGRVITTTTLAWFKQKLLGIVEKELAGKQPVGEYVTEADLDGFAKAQPVGDARDRDSSKPSYGLK